MTLLPLHKLFLAMSTPPAEGAEGAPAGSPLQPLITIILMFVIFYFLLIRPQRKKQQELQKRIAAIKTGDRVITTGGMHGLVANVKETSILLKVADNVKIEMEKSSVATVLQKGENQAEKK